MSKLYVLWILLKYQFYKRVYWKFKKPSKPSGFYGWQEINYDILDQKGIAYGTISKQDTQ